MSDDIQAADSTGMAAGLPEDANQIRSVNWVENEMQTTYSNVVNASSTREEVNLFFGINNTWNLNEAQELKVLLSNRIVLSPFAAKRLWILLGNILRNYESRFGPLDITSQPK